MDCNVKSKWFKLFAPWAHKPILKEHGLVQTNTIAFGSWKAHKYVEGQGHFSML
jgi:hypothetical protein